MSDDQSQSNSAEAEIYGEMVLADTIPGYSPQKPKSRKREVDPELVEAARRIS